MKPINNLFKLTVAGRLVVAAILLGAAKKEMKGLGLTEENESFKGFILAFPLYQF